MAARKKYPDGPPHGTTYRYNHYGCRCDACRAVCAAYERVRRQRPEVAAAAAVLKRRRAQDPETHALDLATSRAWKERNRARQQAYDREYRLRRKHGEPVSRPESPFERLVRVAA